METGIGRFLRLGDYFQLYIVRYKKDTKEKIQKKRYKRKDTKEKIQKKGCRCIIGSHRREERMQRHFVL